MTENTKSDRKMNSREVNSFTEIIGLSAVNAQTVSGQDILILTVASSFLNFPKKVFCVVQYTQNWPEWVKIHEKLFWQLSTKIGRDSTKNFFAHFS